MDETGQAAWIENRMRALQHRWHDLFDEDTAAARPGNLLPRPDPVPARIEEDARLLSGLSAVAAATRKRCFGVLPQGAEMYRRLDEHLTDEPGDPLPEDDARAMLSTLATLVRAAKPGAAGDWSGVTVIDHRAAEATALLRQSTTLHALFERPSSEALPEDSLPSLAAMHFLAFPLAAMAGNRPELGNHITGILSSYRQDRVHACAYRLWRRGWTVHPGESGVVLCHRGP